METYTGGDQWATETYMIPVPVTNVNMTPAPSLQEASAVGSEIVPEFIVNQGIYYPAAANYHGYYCTGLESPGEWDDHYRCFGLDGQDLHSQGLPTEGMQYVYYTPDYAYAQSLYNPYNPFIPGAVVGIDSPFIASQQYMHSSPAYHQPVSSPSYFPTVAHHGMDVFSTVVPDPTPLVKAGGRITSLPENSVVRYILPSTSGGTTIPVQMESSRAALQPHALLKSSEGLLHHHLSVKPVPATGIPRTPKVHNGLGQTQTADNFPQGNGSTLPVPLKVSLPFYNGFNGFGPGIRCTAGEKHLKYPFTGSTDNGNGNTDMLGEQNRGPRTSKSGARFTSPILVKAYTSKAGNVDENGNIKIDSNQYNRDDFPVNYLNAKFFVIKSYSEDDVHKSIKYNVWSSTPNGNKRLDLVYEDAQRISGVSKMMCPVFLFFSVNASGQFCGVAEMIGPVNFYKDMDFWQQDKWSGSFPVKWHIVKDVPNTSFRHIILENNENKPVTNSRDTQEILYIPGLNMLSIFKDSPMRTSVLDDFIYYEERQKVMYEEKTRLLGRYHGNHVPITTFVPPCKVSITIKAPPKLEEKANVPKDVKKIDSHHLDAAKVASENVGAGSRNVTVDESLDKIEDKDDLTCVQKIQTLSISSEVNGSVESTFSETHISKVDTFTVGSMPVKVNGFGDSSEVLTVTTIALDPEAKAVKEKRSTVTFVTE